MLSIGSIVLLVLLLNYVLIYSYAKDVIRQHWNNVENQTQFCPEEELHCGNRTLKWKKTPVHTIALPEQPCLDINQRIVKRDCRLFLGTATWSTLEADCSEMDLISNATGDLYSYLKQTYNDGTVDIVIVSNFYKKIHKFEVIDFVILFECIQKIPGEVSSKLNILVNMMSELKDKDAADISGEIADAILNNLDECISNSVSVSVSVESPNIYVAAWKPFQNDIIGIALYNSTNNFGNSAIVNIYSNQTPNEINTKNLEAAAFFPYTFLQSLIQGLHDIAKKNFYVTMWLLNGEIFSQWYLGLEAEMSNIIGVSIPNFCKKNNQPMLRAFFRTSAELKVSEWIDFGAEYIDSSNDPQYTCALSQVAYFGYCSSNISIPKGYYESTKENYCMATTIKTATSEIILKQTPVATVTYPKNYCIGIATKIPKIFCLPNGKFKILPISDMDCVTDHPVSKYTHALYNMATECWNINETLLEQIFVTKNNLSYIDKMFLFDIIWCLIEYKMYDGIINVDSGLVSDLFDKTYSINDDIPGQYFDLPYISYPLAFYDFVSKVDTDRTDVYLIIKPNFIYFMVSPFVDDIVGLVLYRHQNASSFLSYQLKYLTWENVTNDHSLDSTIELMLHISFDALNYNVLNNISMDEKSSIKIAAAILYKYEFLEAKYRIKSRVIAFKGMPHKNFDVSVDVYLRTIKWESVKEKYTKDEGVWYSVKPNKALTTLVFVSEHEGEACESIDRITILRVTDNKQHKSSRKMIKEHKQVDIISQVSMSVNYANSEKNIEKLYYRHSWILKLLMHIGGGLSWFGFVAIFSSAILFKNWYKKRFYSIQLSIALACQNVHFIVNTTNVSAAEYILFYYSILAQFTWMSIIGYRQYIKFIQVFRESELSVMKALGLGWLVPALITLVAIFTYKDCFSCNFCIRNSNIFMYFVVSPVCLVIVLNLILYVAILINIYKSKWHQQTATVRSNKKRAVVLLAFILGLSWIFIFALISPWTWLALVGCYLFHIIAPLQGFILFTFIIVLDKHSKDEWNAFLKIRARIEYFTSSK